MCVPAGESGAGKTEAARVCLQCVVVAGEEAAGCPAAAGRAGPALTAAGTLLEAFGNAATIRNHNASRFVSIHTCLLRILRCPALCCCQRSAALLQLWLRFLLQGKLLEIEFDFKGEPVGGHITHCELPN